MALAAVPPSHSAFNREPVWDEAIVPALRKRLESESQALAKRMSAASMNSLDEYATEGPTSSSSQAYKDRSATPTSLNSRPSAIPRPSLQQSRTGESSTTVTGRSSRSGSFQRSRTVSQPFPFDSSTLSQSPPPMPLDSASRATSPNMSGSRGTRIPISRARTGSTASAHQPSFSASLNSRGDSRTGFNKSNGHTYVSELPPDLWPVDESQSYGTHSTFKTLRSQVSNIANEKPPFNPSIASTRREYEDEFASPRMSTDSEERPFEHWYRGDVSRNGGVGELRVGRKQEMLDIANYGHTIRQTPSRAALSGSSRSRSNSRGRETNYSHLRHRPRADSLDARGSLYIEDDSLVRRSPVLDERPLTDLDNDEDDEDYDEGYYDDDGTDVIDSYARDVGAVSPPHSLDRSDTPTLVDVAKSSGFKSRIPTPTPRAITPTSTHPLPPDIVTTPKPLTSVPSQQSSRKSASTVSTPTTPGPTTTAKRKAKSPAPTSAAKRTRQKSPAKPAQKKKDDKPRESAQYPAPEGDDIMHAVPSWTQPVPHSGNWDDVVLPVVARKKGLDEHYQQADGSPKPRPKSNLVAPAPGTFGFDHSKYRGSRADGDPEDINLDDFGQRHEALAVQTEDLHKPKKGNNSLSPSPSPSPLSAPPRIPAAGSPRAESPAPFSQYSAPEPAPLPQIQVTRPSTDLQKMEITEEAEASGGCCKCVIM